MLRKPNQKRVSVNQSSTANWRCTAWLKWCWKICMPWKWRCIAGAAPLTVNLDLVASRRNRWFYSFIWNIPHLVAGCWCQCFPVLVIADFDAACTRLEGRCRCKAYCMRTKSHAHIDHPRWSVFMRQQWSQPIGARTTKEKATYVKVSYVGWEYYFTFPIYLSLHLCLLCLVHFACANHNPPTIFGLITIHCLFYSFLNHILVPHFISRYSCL